MASRKPNPERVCPSCGKTFQLKRYLNRIENLELWASNHGKGQRVADKIDHAIAVLTEQGIFIPENNSTWVNGLLSL